ncbi:MAG: polyprenyl synthetase family protein [Nitrososphaerales archaeon]
MPDSAMSPSFPVWLDEYLEPVNSQISSLYKGGSALNSAVTDALSTKGKRIRAILALLWCEAISGDYQPAMPIAVAYELAHAAALVQDDIIDGSPTRRGRKSIVNKYGISNAILTSNMLLFQVPKKLAEYSDLKVTCATLCRLFDMLGESYGAATLGEFLDLEMARQNTLSESDYEQMIKLKTGALIGASSASGAIIGIGDDVDDNLIESAYTFGELLGTAYQIRDDLLDLMGEEAIMGKPAFTDMRSGKRNLVLIHTLKRCSIDEKSFIMGLFGNGDSYERKEIETARELFARYGSVDHANKTSLQYVGRAKEVLSSLKESKARERLRELSDYLAVRSY